MATTFRSDSTQAQPPPWCKKVIFPPAIALVDGNPSRLVCFCYWQVDVPPDYVDQVHMMILRYRPGTDDWIGESADAGVHLKCQVVKEDDTGLYTIILTLMDGAAELDDDSWHQVDAGELPALNSGELHHSYEPATDRNGVHVAA